MLRAIRLCVIHMHTLTLSCHLLMLSLALLFPESTPPVNFMVTAITNTSASFQWSRPLDANGIISAYYITLNDGAADIEMIITNLMEPLQATFSDLQPFVSYIATIFATNDFGNGVSTELSFSTNTGSKHIIFVLHVYTCTYTSIVHNAHMHGGLLKP